MLPIDKGGIKWLLKQGRPSLRLHILSILCILASGILLLIHPLIIRWLIDVLLPRRDLKKLPIAAGIFLLAYAGQLVCDFLGALLNFKAIQKTVFRMRLTLLRRLQKLPAEYHENNSVGDIAQRLQQEVDQIGQIGGEVLPSLLRLLTVSSLMLIAMFALNPRLTYIILPLIPALVLLRQHFYMRLRTCSDVAQKQSGAISGFLQEHLSFIVQIQLLAREIGEGRRFARLSGDGVRAQVARKKTELLFALSSAAVVFIGVTSVLCYGGYEVIKGSLSVGGLIAFYTYSMQLFLPVYNIVDMYSKLHRAGASLRRVMDIARAEISIRDTERSLALPAHGQGSIELKDVSFWYKSDRPVLTKSNLKVVPGERVALVGSTGAGKTTIARLLARLYDVREGSVSIDGYDVRDIKLKSLRSAVSLVPQEPVLFDGTLLQNLMCANPKARESDVREAIEIAQLEGLIKRLPKGWDEPVGPRGTKLSGGERQRVALARSLLRHPSILILDEPTSALDRITGMHLFNALNEYANGRTIIIITHRADAMIWADRVILLDHGRIVGDATHNELIERNGLYRKLCRDQARIELAGEDSYSRRDGHQQLHKSARLVAK